MVDAASEDETAELFDGLTALGDLLNAGDGGLVGVQRTVDLAPAATGASGAAFVEFGSAGGRVVAASGALSWSLGLPIFPSLASRDHGLQRDRVREFKASNLGADGPRLMGLGMHRVLVADAIAGQRRIGLLSVCYPDHDQQAPARIRSAIAFLASHIATQYALGRGLPVYVDGPTLSTSGEAPAKSDERDLFLALTGHELRTPVTVIRGYADTLSEHWDSLDEDARREAVFVIGQRSRELARLVDRLLNAVSDDDTLAGGYVNVMPFDLIDALSAGIDELSADLRRCLKVALPVSLPKAQGDRISLATVLTELTTNACKYSPNWVEVELTAGADAQTVWFRVADRGVGIRPEHVERAFERFWQLETGDQRAYGGVGLGLYLVRRIIERQHGWVSLRPREGGGTVAEVRLPRADASHGEA
jgi:signal transduction histidine kinase